jgi:hypothetical protein
MDMYRKPGKVFYISDLPGGALSQLRCALVLCCHKETKKLEENESPSPLVDAIESKGAMYAGAIVGGKIHPEDVAPIANIFWSLATGNVPQQGDRQLLPPAQALQEAYKRYGNWNFRENRVEGKNLQFAAYSRVKSGKENELLVPAAGGPDEEALKALGNLPEPVLILKPGEGGS